MQTLQAFLSRLNPLVPGCPEPVALQALVDSAIGFCQDTDVAQLEPDPVPLVAGQAEYDLDLPAQHVANRLFSVRAGTRLLGLTGVYEEPAGRPWPTAHLASDRVTLVLDPAPADNLAGQALSYVVSLVPLRTAQTVPDELFNDWAEAVVAGAVVRLASQPGATYTSADLVGFSQARYEMGVRDAKVGRSFGRTVLSRRLAGPLFTGVRR